MSKPIKVPFHGATLYVVDHNGEPYTPLKPIVEGMGLDWEAQHRKFQANAERWGISLKEIPSRGGKQEAACIPLRKLAGWLMTLHPSRVKPELRDKITAYQNECDDALWKYWSEGAAERRAKPGAPQPVQQARAANALEAGTRQRMLLTIEGCEVRVQKIGRYEHVFDNCDILRYITEGIGGRIADLEFVATIAQACADRFRAEANKQLRLVKGASECKVN